MKRTWKLTVLAASILGVGGGAFVAGRAWASGVPATGALTYSGTLQDSSGAPVTGSHNLEVSFWNAASGGTTPLCDVKSAGVALVGGQFSIALPDACATGIHGSPDVWAEVFVEGSTLGRVKLGAVPYALEAAHATSADTATVAANATVTAAVAASAVRTETTNCAEIDPTHAVECVCKSTEIAISGGAYSGTTANALNASQFGPSIGRPAQNWRVSCIDTTGARVTCVSPFAVCLAVQ